MKSPFVTRIVMTGLACLTVGTGIWYVVEHHQASAHADEVASIQSSMLTSQVSVVRLKKELSDTSTGTSQVVKLPKGPDQSDLLRQLQSAATSASVTLQATSFVPPGPAKTGQGGTTSTDSSVSTTIQATGSYDALLHFVHQLQAGPRPVRVHSMQLAGTGASQSQLTLQLAFPFS